MEPLRLEPLRLGTLRPAEMPRLALLVTLFSACLKKADAFLFAYGLGKR